MQLTGAEIIVECLKEQGVDTVFGYPGGAILNVYDALYEYKDEITHVLTSHEQGASHAADGYARATGKVGVCLATSGPGATNLVTGIATAYMDSVPMVAITANVGRPLLGRDSFQEVDIAGIVMPVTKYSFIVKNIEDLADTLRRAFYIAKSGRPGPVLVDVPKDITGMKYEYEPCHPATVNREIKSIRKEDIDQALEMIREAEKPFIFVGGGCVISGADQEVRELARRIQAPVCDTLMGKGTFPGEDPLYTGMVGMHGTKTSDLGVTECDLLIVLGARFSDRVTGNTKTFAHNAKILQIDVDASEINKNIVVDHCIAGDAKLVLRKLSAQLNQMEHVEWMQYINELKTRYPLTYPKDRLTGPQIVETIYEMTHGDAVICTEVGQHQMWATQYIELNEKKRFITSGGLGTMGFGFPAAIGAKIGCPDKEVICITGDGGFQMNIQEMATAVTQGTGITICLLNNNYLGMVRQMQELFYGKRYSATCLRRRPSCPGGCKGPNDQCPEYVPDFVKLAESYGAYGIRVEKEEDIDAAFAEAKKHTDAPTIIEFMIATDELVLPMVKSGNPMSEMILK